MRFIRSPFADMTCWDVRRDGIRAARMGRENTGREKKKQFLTLAILFATYLAG